MHRTSILATLASCSTPPGEGGAPPLPTPPPAPQPGQSYTQDDLSRIATAEHAKGQRKGEADALAAVQAQLGGVSLAEAAALIKAKQDADAANQSEAERVLAAARTEKEQAAADRAAAAAELHAARLERALTAAGVAADAVPAINLPGVSVGSTPAEIEAAVADLKAKVPALFGTVPTPKPTPLADPRRPGAGAPPAPPSGTLGGEGLARFEKRFGAPAQS